MSIDLIAEQRLKIATINLFNFLAPPNAYYDFINIYSHEQWQKKCDWLIQYLAIHQPDVVGFQEVFSIDALRNLALSAGYPYFAVVDQPEVSDGFIYRSPVVALASKYEIVDVAPCEPDSKLAALMGLSDTFQFSRVPLRATVALPFIGSCDCYIVHFKSKRGQFDVEQGLELLGEHITEMQPSFAIEAAAKWSAAIVRGSEASLLRYAIAKRRAETQNAVVLMGDFNDSLNDGVLMGLTSKDTRLLTCFSVKEFQQYRLQDAYQLFEDSHYCPTAIARPATHYHQNQGAVIDYILLSSEFDPHNDQCLAEVEHYHTYERHLINPEYALDSHSTDHAPVMITLRVRQ
ncbi:endonuclease/exonuclease/phosphatase family protein [Shewanella psychrotolerans]|uniref:endonuclease/exonuclease/phosphatase family protein n=1 Tax=Shewanella psychrotolerans TaxID=2864206 RepID=UPI001C65D1F0|nr:endonuclease/exonuclease/phosphatase family protein [Shewanella psychrotolerans]QYK02034.1 endonuclease/exonuclease/phosphatase family protein [Shewanella psychrotolerans]